MPVNTMLKNNPISALENFLVRRKRTKLIEQFGVSSRPPFLKDQQDISIGHWMGTALSVQPSLHWFYCWATLVLLGTEGVRCVIFQYCAIISLIFPNNKVPYLTVRKRNKIKPKPCRYIVQYILPCRRMQNGVSMQYFEDK